MCKNNIRRSGNGRLKKVWEKLGWLVGKSKHPYYGFIKFQNKTQKRCTDVQLH